MANDSSKVTVGKPKTSGAIYRAPVGTTLPTNAESELATAFVALGYVSEDGVTNSRSIDSEAIKAWGGDNVFTVQSGRDDTFEFSLIEAMNVNAMKVYNGDNNVTGNLTDGISITANNGELGSHSYVIDQILRGGRLKRIVIPDGQVSDVEDITYKDDELIAYGVTITANQDDAGNTHYEYFAGEGA